MNRRYIFRINAGFAYGYGHLSRCMNLIDEFDTKDEAYFLIKTDDKAGVKDYLARKESKNKVTSADFLHPETNPEKELETLIEKVKALEAFLVLDHYNVTKNYQLALTSAKVKWLQFDSHGKGPFYSDIVLHASPSATEKLYKPLSENKSALLLLGTRYAVINHAFRKANKKIKPREKLKHIFVSFGGGSNNGTLNKFLSVFDTNLLKYVSVDILIGQNSPDSAEAQELVLKHRNMHLHIGQRNVIPFMTKADLAIISPGTLSYEAACLGLPMLTIPFADNQLMNAEGWANIECAINLGLAANLSARALNGALNTLLTTPELIANMSAKCLAAVDGKGATRVKQAIDKNL